MKRLQCTLNLTPSALGHTTTHLMCAVAVGMVALVVMVWEVVVQIIGIRRTAASRCAPMETRRMASIATIPRLHRSGGTARHSSSGVRRLQSNASGS